VCWRSWCSGHLVLKDLMFNRSRVCRGEPILQKTLLIKERGRIKGQIYTPPPQPTQTLPTFAQPSRKPYDLYSVVSRHVAKQSKSVYVLEANVDDWFIFRETYSLVTRGESVDSLAGRGELGNLVICSWTCTRGLRNVLLEPIM